MTQPKIPSATPNATPYTPSRREFVRDVAAGAALLATLPVLEACGTTPSARSVPAPDATTSRFGTQLDLPALPWAKDALAPYISEETVTIHYERHHAGYAKKLASAVAALPAVTFRTSTLEGLIAETRGSRTHGALFNAAGQLSNHNIYWRSLTPKKTEPSADLMALITRDFGSMADLKAALKSAALGQFGSGWAWLAARDGGLVVMATPDAEDPTASGARPLLTLDVWEHAYYVDYRNDRGAHITALLDNIMNWDEASRLLRA